MMPKLTIYRYDHYFAYAGTEQLDGVSNSWAEAVYILPAHSTILKPPSEAGMVAVYDPDRERWQLVADMRGETWFSNIGAPIVVQRPGDPKGFGLREQQWRVSV